MAKKAVSQLKKTKKSAGPKTASVKLHGRRKKPQTERRKTADKPKQPQADSKEIHFYRSNEKPYGALSNLYRRAFQFEGREYPTAEHAYQAGKPAKDVVRDWILSAPSPALLAMAAHGLYSWDVVPNWANIKFDRMRRVLHAKFSQHPDLAKLLIETKSARLVEAGRVANAVNKTWGEVNGKGRNMLGKLLMEVRDELAKTPAQK
jgi:ribA/ribD-fused uncharacterized protein